MSPLTVFFVLAYALSWWPSLIEPHGILPLGPLVAALVLLGATTGISGVREFVAKIVRFRVPAGWCVLVLGLPAALTAAAVGLNVLTGSAPPAWDRTPPLTDLPATFLSIFLLIGLGEEPAWRGFALPRLLSGRSSLMATLSLAALHIVWHLPLFGLEYDFQNGPPVGALASRLHRRHDLAVFPNEGELAAARVAPHLGQRLCEIRVSAPLSRIGRHPTPLAVRSGVVARSDRDPREGRMGDGAAALWERSIRFAVVRGIPQPLRRPLTMGFHHVTI